MFTCVAYNTVHHICMKMSSPYETICISYLSLKIMYELSYEYILYIHGLLNDSRFKLNDNWDGKK